jgi:hypothetical protein
MKPHRNLLTLAAVMLVTMSLSSVPPAQAKAAWAPGFYAGWVSLSARLDTNTQAGSQMQLEFFVIEKYEGRGQLMVKVDDQGTGGASIVLPVGITLLDYGKITSSKGSCAFSSSIVGQTNYVRLRKDATDVSTAFQVPISLAPSIRFKSTNAASTGELKGCEQAAPGNLRAMKTAMRVTTAEMQQLNFQVGYNDGASIGGSCSIEGWEKTTPVYNGQGVRSLGQCTWRVFKVVEPNQSAEWTK